MPSSVNPSIPASGSTASKSAFRGQFAAIKSELEHGGFLTPQATGGIQRRVVDKLFEESVSITDFGAVADAREVVASWGAATSTVTASVATFLPTDVGKLFFCIKGRTGENREQQGTIATYVSPTQVTLSIQNVVAQTNQRMLIGTDNYPAIQAAVDHLKASSATQRKLTVPAAQGDGYYLISNTIDVANLNDTVIEGSLKTRIHTGEYKMAAFATLDVAGATNFQPMRDAGYRWFPFNGTVRPGAHSLTLDTAYPYLQAGDLQPGDWILIRSNELARGAPVMEINRVKARSGGALTLEWPTAKTYRDRGDLNDLIDQVPPYNSQDFLATGAASITAGSRTLTVVGAAFDANVRGRYFVVAGAGPSGGPMIARAIRYITATSVELNEAAHTTISGVASSVTIYDQRAGRDVGQISRDRNGMADIITNNLTLKNLWLHSETGCAAQLQFVCNLKVENCHFSGHKAMAARGRWVKAQYRATILPRWNGAEDPSFFATDTGSSDLTVEVDATSTGAGYVHIHEAVANLSAKMTLRLAETDAAGTTNGSLAPVVSIKGGNRNIVFERLHVVNAPLGNVIETTGGAFNGAYPSHGNDGTRIKELIVDGKINGDVINMSSGTINDGWTQPPLIVESLHLENAKITDAKLVNAAGKYATRQIIEPGVLSVAASGNDGEDYWTMNPTTDTQYFLQLDPPDLSWISQVMIETELERVTDVGTASTANDVKFACMALTATRGTTIATGTFAVPGGADQATHDFVDSTTPGTGKKVRYDRRFFPVTADRRLAIKLERKATSVNDNYPGDIRIRRVRVFWLDGQCAHKGAWNDRPTRIGDVHLWQDATGDLRVKNGAPTSDLDGTVLFNAP